MARIAIILLCLSVLTCPLRAQDIPASLIADRIEVLSQGDIIVASGSVQIHYQGQTISAASITYDRRTDTIKASGPLKLQTTEGVVLLASFAEISADLRNGVIQGARLILNEQLQIASVEGRRVNGRYNTLYKSVASSCVVCESRPIPIWQIRAERVIHDEQARRIYFKNAYFDFLGVPIAYLPAFRIPEPGVTRATGMLSPEFSSSDIYGYGIKAPYYITLGDHADATLTPFLTTQGAKILESEYRQRFRNGALRFGSAIAFDDGLNSDDLRGFVNADGHLDFIRGYRARFALNWASDKAFLQEFGYSDDDRLRSFLTVGRTLDHEYVDLTFAAYQSLREDEPAGSIPFLMPDIDYRRVWTNTPVGGRFGVTADLTNLVRQQGRDVLRLGGGADWRREVTLKNGLQMATIADLQFDAYQVNDDPAFTENAITRLVPTLGVELRWPFAKTTSRATHVIEPIAQILLSERFQSGETPNEDSLLPELDETNLFALNRFPGRDAAEIGLRANIGVNYTRYDANGWKLGVTLGQVIRDESNTDFPEASGLRGIESDAVGAVSLELPIGLEIIGRGLFSPEDFEFRRADLEVNYDTTRFGFEASYVFLAADPATLPVTSLPERQEIAARVRYRFLPHWEATAGMRYDVSEDKTTLGEGGLTYGNECIRVGLSVSRRLTTSNNVPTSTNIGLSVNLTGLGSRADDSWPSRHCGTRLQ